MANAQKMALKLRKNNNQYINVDVPTLRQCPECGNGNYNTSQTKTVKCVNCKIQFCFVCLDVYDNKNNYWPCGGPEDYCGYVK